MLQPKDPEKLGNKEGSWGDAWISLGKRNRRDFVSALREGEDGNMSNQVGVGHFRCILYLCPRKR